MYDFMNWVVSYPNAYTELIASQNVTIFTGRVIKKVVK